MYPTVPTVYLIIVHSLVHWNFVYSQPFYGAFLSKAGEYYWRYIPADNRVVLEPVSVSVNTM